MNTIQFTKSGFDELKKELEILRSQWKEAVGELKKAREMGDLSENGYYKAAKFKLGSLDRRIRMANMLLQSAHVTTVTVKESIDIGCTVTIDDGREKKTYKMVGGYESNPSEGKLSIISPIGKALQGRKKGETVIVKTPSGTAQTFQIIDLAY